jgi:hypothetical protein
VACPIRSPRSCSHTAVVFVSVCVCSFPRLLPCESWLLHTILRLHLLARRVCVCNGQQHNSVYDKVCFHFDDFAEADGLLMLILRTLYWRMDLDLRLAVSPVPLPLTVHRIDKSASNGSTRDDGQHMIHLQQNIGIAQLQNQHLPPLNLPSIDKCCRIGLGWPLYNRWHPTPT